MAKTTQAGAVRLWSVPEQHVHLGSVRAWSVGPAQTVQAGSVAVRAPSAGARTVQAGSVAVRASAPRQCVQAASVAVRSLAAPPVAYQAVAGGLVPAEVWRAVAGVLVRIA